MHQFSNWENFSFDSWPWGSSGRGSAGNRPRQRAGGGGARGIFNEVLEKMQKARRKGPGPSEGRILGDRGERADAEPRGAAHTAMNAAPTRPGGGLHPRGVGVALMRSVAQYVKRNRREQTLPASPPSTIHGSLYV